MKLNDNEPCLGESVCLNDERKGVCARRAKDSADETAEDILSRICRRGEGGCKLFDTKPENTPQELAEVIGEVEYWRRRQRQGFPLPPLDEFGAMLMSAFDAADDAHAKIANEQKPESGQGGDSEQPAPRAGSVFANAFGGS